MTIQNHHKEIIRATGVDKVVAVSDRKLQILQHINLTINRGESVAIVGASGSGKTTLLGLLAGLDLPSAGEIYLSDHKLTDMNEDQRAAARAAHVGFVFQSFHLLPNLTAAENVMLPLEILNRASPDLSAAKALQQVDVHDRAAHYPTQLSGGEQQRVAIARAFVTAPAILFADEPTGNLDNKTGHHIAELLFEMNRANETTLVLVTHNNELAKRCQRIVTLEGGQLRE